MAAESHVFQSLTEAQKYFILKDSCSAEDCRSALSLRIRRCRSTSERKCASSGKSQTIQKEAMPIKTVANPSKMKIHAHPCFPPIPPILPIAAASKPPNDPDTAAAEKKIADLIPNSLRLFGPSQLQVSLRMIQMLQLQTRIWHH